MADQVIYRRPGVGRSRTEDVSQTASAPVGNAADSTGAISGEALPSGPELRLFSRAGLAPQDRSLADFYAEAGFNYRSLIPSRGRDLLGVAFSYTNLSGELRELARDANRFHGTHNALPDYEAILETTYQINLAPWLSVQPDMQYIIHPGGSPKNGDALVMGVRTVVTF